MRTGSRRDQVTEECEVMPGLLVLTEAAVSKSSGTWIFFVSMPLLLLAWLYLMGRLFDHWTSASNVDETSESDVCRVD